MGVVSCGNVVAGLAEDLFSHRTISRGFAVRALLLVVALCLSLPTLAQPQTKVLTDGVTLTQDINADPTSPMVINVLRIDPKRPGVKLAVALGNDTIMEAGPTKGREDVSDMVARKNALAGVNADFFPFTGDPLGLAIVDGELVSEPMNRAALGITAGGDFMLDRVSFCGTCATASGESCGLGGINRPRRNNEVMLYTPAYGVATDTKDGVEVILSLDGPVRANADITATATSDPVASVCSLLPVGVAVLSANGLGADWLTRNVHKGDKIKIRMDVVSAFGKSWENVTQAVGGGPWLLKGGETFIDAAIENFKPPITMVRQPRTAAGVTATGELLLVTVDGRQSISFGMTLSDMAALMKSLGAVDAINLDGGGSTTLSIRGLVINSPSGGVERPVADGLLVYAPAPNVQAPVFNFAEAGPLNAASGEAKQLSLLDESTCKPVSDDIGSSVIWGTTGGIGFVNQKGYFIPIKAGKGEVTALSGERRVELPVVVVPGKPSKLVAKIAADPSVAPNRSQVNVTLTDANDNPVSGQTVTFSVKGGLPDAPTMSTDDNGAAVFGVTWTNAPADATISVSAAGLTAVAK